MRNVSEIKVLKESLKQLDGEIVECTERGNLSKALELLSRRHTLSMLLISLLERLTA